MLQEFVNNPKYLVKIGFQPWSILEKQLDFNADTRVQIKLKCEHKNIYNSYGINYCSDCDETLKITSS